MLFVIAVNIYTVRLLWQALGIDNYGIYNVVGGIVMMFSFINSAMIGSTQRFMSFALGKGDSYEMNKTFSISIRVHFMLGVIIILLAETVGLWFLNERMNIPAGRMFAANCVYQCSIISLILTVLSVPYNAAIVAHEHMKIYGYFGILDVSLKLLIVWLVIALPWDPLITYAILVVVVAAIMRLIYGIYCIRKFEECKYRRHRDSKLLKEMLKFAQWTFVGVMGITARDQGMNIVLNLFFNVAVNAAKGIANQIVSIINGFASNFTMALNPQIIKNYATGNNEEFIKLMCLGSKYALVLMSIVVVPLFFCSEALLKLWLGTLAPYTVGFLQLGLLLALNESVVSPVTTAIQATGDIKKFQILVSIIMLSSLLLAWIGLKIVANPYMVMYVMIGVSIVAIIIRLRLLHSLISYSYRKFFLSVYSRSIPVIILEFTLIAYIRSLFSDSLFEIILFGLLSVTIILFLTYSLIMTKSERGLVVEKIKSKLHIR